MLLASLCILQGYTWLDFIPDSRRHSSALWFAGIVLVSVMFLSRPERGRRRVPVQWLTLVMAVAVAVVTLPAVYGHFRAVGDAMGVLDLLLAASALGAAVVGSRAGSRLPLRSPGRTGGSVARGRGRSSEAEHELPKLGTRG